MVFFNPTAEVGLTCVIRTICMLINDVTSEIIGAAIRVHQALGPGLLESAYRSCFAYEIQ
jgi:hypothetical protein